MGTQLTTMARTTTALLAFAAIAGVAIAADDSNIGSRHAVDLKKAAEEMRSVDESIGSGKLYFTGASYTVNLIPHAIVLGLLALGVVFLFGDSLFGADVSGSGYAAAPATGYDAANRYYDTYAQQAASGLGSATS